MTIYSPEKQLGAVLPQQAGHVLLHGLGKHCSVVTVHPGRVLLKVVAEAMLNIPMQELRACFRWPRIVINCLLQLLGHTELSATALADARGSDTDFSGGAAAWEQAACMLNAACREANLAVDLTPRSICDSELQKNLSEGSCLGTGVLFEC